MLASSLISATSILSSPRTPERLFEVADRELFSVAAAARMSEDLRFLAYVATGPDSEDRFWSRK